MQEKISNDRDDSFNVASCYNLCDTLVRKSANWKQNNKLAEHEDAPCKCRNESGGDVFLHRRVT